MVMLDSMFPAIKDYFPDNTTDKMLVKTMATRMMFDPKSPDLAVATNLHADKLSDLAAR